MATAPEKNNVRNTACKRGRDRSRPYKDATGLLRHKKNSKTYIFGLMTDLGFILWGLAVRSALNVIMTSTKSESYH